MRKLREYFENMKYRMIVKSMLAKEEAKNVKKKIEEFNEDNRGIAIIEVILILVVIMALIVVFRKNIKNLLDDIFKQIEGNKKDIIKKY